jgi:hypothetical protein
MWSVLEATVLEATVQGHMSTALSSDFEKT